MSDNPKSWFAATGWVGEGTPKDAKVICRVDNYPYGETENRLKLIAAAPELLRALKLLYAEIEDEHMDCMRQARAAIAKAEGGR